MLRHFLDLDLLPAETLRGILTRAREMKANGQPNDIMRGKTLVMIFEKPSTRTRVSFEVGVREMGGTTVILSDNDSQLGRGETVADTARVLSRYADAIMLRTHAADKLREFADNATIPVINGLTAASHPCQIMADIMTFEERKGPIAGKTIAWVGDGNNVAASWLHAAAKFNFALKIASPSEFSLPSQMIAAARNAGADVTVVHEPAEAAKGADCIVTDTWISMGDEDHMAARLRVFHPYQVNAKLMKQAKKDAVFMHCLPAHRGQEVTDEVIDGPQSIVWDEAENRLHSQKAILAWCLEVA